MTQNKLTLSIMAVVILSVLLILISCTKRVERPEDLVSSCNKLEKSNVANERDICFNGLAYAKNDFKLCNDINDGGLKGNCYHVLALRNNDSSLCASPSVGISRSGCYWDFAKMTKDSTFCDKIESDFYKDQCKKELAK